MRLGSRLKPRAVTQHSGKGNTARADRDQIIKLLQRFRIFPKARIDLGSQQGGLDESRILSERFVAILNSKVVFALPCENFRANIERRPESGIGAKGRVHIACCTRNIAIFQPIFYIRAYVQGRPSPRALPDYDWYACVNSRSPGTNCNKD